MIAGHVELVLFSGAGGLARLCRRQSRIRRIVVDFISQAVNLFHKGGPVMYLLVICSLTVVAVAVERFAYYRSVSVDVPAFLSRLQPLLERERIAEAAQLCEKVGGIAGQVALQGMKALQRGANVENTQEGAALLAIARLREHLNYLSVIVTLAPLLGLLGTVIGMINSFSVLNIRDGQPLAITGGVGEALVATATGLAVAIMALVTHTYFAHRLDGLVTDLEQVCATVVNNLPQKKTLRRDAHEIA